MENYETLYKEVCRICLTLSNDQMVVLLKENSEVTSYGRDLETFTRINIENVKAPPKMCQDCLNQLNQTKLFINNCKTSQLYFENIKNCSEFYRKKIVVDNVLSYSKQSYTVPITLKETKLEIKKEKEFEIPISYANDTVKYNPESDSFKPLIFKNETVPNNQFNINKTTPNAVLSLLKNNLDIKIELVKKEGKAFQKPIINNVISNEIVSLPKKYSPTKIPQLPSIRSTTKFDKPIFKIPSFVDKDLRLVKKTIQQESKPKIEMKKSRNSTGHYVCDICGKSFKKKYSMSIHLNRHQPKLCCEHCNKAYPTKKELQYHTLSRHGIGQYFRCTECDFKSCVKHELDVHRSIHTGERPYVCDQCGMDFRTAYVFKNHLLVHTEKTIQCPKCPLKFRNTSRLRVHDNNVHERRNLYACTVCQRVYARIKSVRKHLVNVHAVPRDKQGKVPLIKVKDADEAQLAAAASSFRLSDDKSN